MIRSFFLFAAVLALALAAAPIARAADGLIVKPSAFGAKETLDRLEAALKAKGIAVFARIDHAAGAKTVGQDLAPTQVLIFGSPKMGTPLMAATRSMAIDLPLKVAAWQDDKGSWIAYNNPKWLAARHGNKLDKVIAAMTDVLTGLTAAAANK